MSAKTDTPCSAVSLRQLSCLLSVRSYIPMDHVSEIKFIMILLLYTRSSFCPALSLSYLSLSLNN